MAPTSAKKTTPSKPIKQILEFLRNELAALQADPAAFKQMLRQAGLAESTLSYYSSGKHTPGTIASTKLASFFQNYDSRIQPRWFQVREFEQFKRYYDDAGVLGRVTFAVRNPEEQKKQIKSGLPGLYVTYRHSFDSDTPNFVAREVLLINNDLSFRMSFLTSFADDGEKPEFFEGQIIPIGESIVFVSFSRLRRALTPDRGRVIFCHGDNLHRECRFGIISSTRLHHERSPCAACIFFVRVAANVRPKEIEKFYEACTRIGPFDSIIPADFGDEVETREFLEICLDNSPIGAPRTNERLRRLEGEQSSPEQILRLNLSRFNREMPQVIRRVMNNEAIKAPFKPGWPGFQST